MLLNLLVLRGLADVPNQIYIKTFSKWFQHLQNDTPNRKMIEKVPQLARCSFIADAKKKKRHTIILMK